MYWSYFGSPFFVNSAALMFFFFVLCMSNSFIKMFNYEMECLLLAGFILHQDQVMA